MPDTYTPKKVPSLFVMLLYEFKRQQVPVIRCTKSTLVHVSHALEDLVLSQNIPAMLFTGFQESAYWEQETQRYLELAKVTRQLCVFAGEPLPPESHASQLHVTLADGDPLRQEWFLAILSDEFSVVLCGQDRLVDVPDEGMRQFDTVWSFEPGVVERVLDILEGVVQTYRPEKLAELQAARATYTVREPDLSIISNLTLSMIEFESTLNQRLAQASYQLQDAVTRFEEQTSELQRRNREVEILSEMSVFLHSAMTFAEVYTLVEEYGLQLFPDTAGGLYVLTNSEVMLELTVQWGNFNADTLLSPGDCWAIRMGRLHSLAPYSKLRCVHCNGISPEQGMVCIPLTAQNETFGLLHIQLNTTVPEPSFDTVARAFSERIALAAANLRLRETLRIRSIRDPLTGLFNRRYLEESLDRELHRAARHRQALGIIMLDIDYFKRLNDTFSHRAGDAYLKEFGGLLAAHTRGEDISCRYGGEEFCIILPESTIEATQQRAEDLRREVKQLKVTYRYQLLDPMTVSAGVACFPEHGTSVDDLISRADMALYQAKRAGRDQVFVADVL